MQNVYWFLEMNEGMNIEQHNVNAMEGQEEFRISKIFLKDLTFASSEGQLEGSQINKPKVRNQEQMCEHVYYD